MEDRGLKNGCRTNHSSSRHLNRIDTTSVGSVPEGTRYYPKGWLLLPPDRCTMRENMLPLQSIGRDWHKGRRGMKTLIAALCGLLLAWVVVLPAQANTLDFDSLTMGSTGITSISLNSIAVNTTDANNDKTLAISAGTINSAYANLPDIVG